MSTTFLLATTPFASVLPVTLTTAGLSASLRVAVTTRVIARRA